MEFPGYMASFRETDAYLRDRGWVPDGPRWRLTRGPRVIIADGQEALRFQVRSDAVAKRRAAHPQPKEPPR